MQALLAGSMALPKSHVDAAYVREQTTYEQFTVGSDEAVQVVGYTEDANYLYVPRQWGLSYCTQIGLAYEDCTSTGERLVFQRVPNPREYQVPVLAQLEGTAGSYYDFMFRARTGFGKTITGLILASRIGHATLIVVDQENLKDQWLDALEEHFGMARGDVGIIQGKVVNLRPVTIAMIQSASRMDLPDEALDYFGTVLVDEVHTAGAPIFSLALGRFNATVRIGVSATPKRKDGLQPLLEGHLGPVRVYVADAHEESSLWVIKNETTYSWYANSSPKAGRYINEVTDDAARNLRVAEVAKFLLDTGRDTLVLSDRIEQLTHLRNLCVYLGVEEDATGLYVGSYTVYAYAKDPKPSRRPPYLESGAPYTPVSLQLISKKTPKPTLTRIKQNARLLFATYNMFAKGVDVPRLAGGVDASPRSNAEQMHGRILRVEEGKPVPIWVTCVDTNSYRSVNQLVQRLPDYLRNNASVCTLDDEWMVTECRPEDLTREMRARVAKLKTAQIETTYEGLHTLRFPALPTELGGRAGSGIRLSKGSQGLSRQEALSQVARGVRSPTRKPNPQ